MQELFVIGVAAGLIGGLSLWVRDGSVSRQHIPWAWRIALGAVAGLLGAVAVLIPRTDLIPDELEPAIWVIVVTVVSAALVVGTRMRV